MIINKDDGEINLGEILVNPKLTFSEFKKTEYFQLFKLFVGNPPWKSYVINDIKVKLGSIKYRADLVIYFKKEKIESADFGLIEVGEDLPKWDQKTEEHKKSYYDDLLEKTLGIPPYNYSWGKVESYYDPKGCTSGILVSYQSEVPCRISARRLKYE